MTAQRLAHEVLVNLSDQVRLYSHLLELSRAQLDAVRVQDVRSVHAILQEIEIAMLDRSRHEQRRELLIREVAAVLGIGQGEVTAARLQAACDAPIAAEIGRASEELRAIVKDLDDVVSRNRAYLEHELSVVDHMVKGMTVDRSATPTYMRSGAQRDTVRLKLLDAQV